MKVGVIVEEPSAVALVKRIAEKVKVSTQIRVARGRETLKKKLDAYARLLSDECQKVIALVDSHCSDPSGVEKNFGVVSNVIICVVVHAIESWLLADKEAIAKTLRVSEVKTTQSPEQLCKPEEELSILFEKHNKRYIKSRDAAKIAEFISPKTLAKKCPSFKKFVDSLKHC